MEAVAYPRGGWEGSGPPTFQKVGPRDSHKNVIKLVGREDKPAKKWSLRFLKSKQRIMFQGLVVWSQNSYIGL